jgi:hypothetical protein
LGKYGTDDPAVAEQHIRWAKEGGIDALVVSWWGPDDLTARHIDRGFLKAKNLDEIRYAVIYESTGRLALFALSAMHGLAMDPPAAIVVGVIVILSVAYTALFLRRGVPS